MSVFSGRRDVEQAGTVEPVYNPHRQTKTCPNADGFAVSGTIMARPDNVGIVVLGDRFVIAALATRNAPPLDRGEWVEVENESLQEIFVDAVNAGDGVIYLCTGRSASSLSLHTGSNCE